MEFVFRLLDSLRQQVIEEVVRPAEDKQTEFHFGRIHGQMLILGIFEERLKEILEEQAAQQQQREREYD